MKRIVVIIALAILGITVPWQLGYDPALLAANSDMIVGWTVVRPSPAIAGKSASFETRIQARVTTVATVEAVVRSGDGRVVWQQRWTDQAFKSWQSRVYTGAWAVPAGQATGPYTLTVTANAASSQTTARVAAAAVANGASRNVAFQVVKATPTPVASPSPAASTATAGVPTATPPPATPTPKPPTATPPATATAPRATNTPAAPTNTPVAPTSTPQATQTVAPPTSTAVPPTPTTAPPTATSLPPTATRTPVPPTATTTPSSGLDVEEANFLRILNDYRQARGMGPVATQPHLMAAAGWMATDMANRNYLSHTDSTGRDPGRRMVEHGYSPYAWMCEIALGGSETGQSAFNVWLNSPPHRGCMVDPKYVSIGIGRAYSTAAGWRWTVNFGSL